MSRHHPAVPKVYPLHPRRGGGSYSCYIDPTLNWSSDSPVLPPDRYITEHLESKALRAITKPDVSSSVGDPPLKPENVKYVGSYNWVDEAHPTIIVPGSPPEWRDREYPYTVPFDQDVRFVDQNGFRMGPSQSCLLPLFRAADVVAEQTADTPLDWSSVDIVTDRNNLRKLLRWIQHPSSDTGRASGASAGPSRVPAQSSTGTIGLDPLKDFRIDVQLGGKKTVLLHRWEKRTREQAQPPRSGCGINFERESTRPAKGCQRSTGHHRITTYDFGGLKLVVRYEVDACLPSTPAASTTFSATKGVTPRTPSPRTGITNVDSLTDALSGLGVSTSSSATTSAVHTSVDVDVIPAGTIVPQSSIIELTTRSVRYIDEFDWSEQYPQLLLSWTPHLFLAIHDRGRFERMIRHALSTPELRTVEQSARVQRGYRQLVAVLKVIQELAQEYGKRGRLSLVCRDGRLEVYERMSDSGTLEDFELERFSA